MDSHVKDSGRLVGHTVGWCLLPPFGPSQILPVSFQQQHHLPYQDLLLWDNSSKWLSSCLAKAGCFAQWSPNTAMLRHCLGAASWKLSLTASLLQVIAWRKGWTAIPHLYRLEWLLVFCSKGRQNEAGDLENFHHLMVSILFLSCLLLHLSSFSVASWGRVHEFLKACISENVFILQGRKICHLKMSPWHTNYFELKAIEAPKTQKVTFPFPLTCLKNLDKGPFSRIGLLLEMFAKITGQVWLGKFGRAQKSESTLCPIVSADPANICLPNICFLILMSIAPSPLKSKTTTPTSSFGFSWTCSLRWELWPFWQITQFSWVSPMCVVAV